ncbi:MAG: hypothetical protein Q4A61_03455 [Porphyromonadaceae bacterium]|nr:hypothetical protein [Porphyromonadaceae bacterium]
MSELRFDLRQEAEREAFRQHVDFLLRLGREIKIGVVPRRRTLRQNRYLHLLLGYIGLQLGETLDYVKTELFKRRINAPYFVEAHTDRVYGRVEALRSSRDLTTRELTECIERLRDWSLRELGLYLPSPDEQTRLRTIEREVEQGRRWIE